MKSDFLRDQFVRIYADESDSVFRFCLLRTSDREVAVDLMQDTFVQFWRVSSRGEIIRNARAFLFTVARHAIIDWYRKKKTISLDRLLDDVGEDKIFFDLPERTEVEMLHEARFLMERLREIDPRYQQVIYFRFVRGFSPREIAKVLGESANTVSVRIHRGLRLLKKITGYTE